MTMVRKFATIPESRLSKRTATDDDAAANQEEIAQQIEEDNVKKQAGENVTGGPTPFVSNKQIESADDAVASREEVEGQAERKRIEKEAFENRISVASAEKWTRGGRTHD